MYEVTTDQQSQPQIEALPAVAGPPFAEARVVLEVAPWGGEPWISGRPDGGLRTLTFGPSAQGMITYLIVEELRRVDILDVLWLD